ncbi:MAG: NPCBM/NEW2 domain-containing protein [Planctomycetota bacterium]
MHPKQSNPLGPILCALLFVISAAASIGFAENKTMWLDEMDISKFVSGWGSTHKNQSVEANPIRIGGKTFQRGIGTHAPCIFWIQLDGMASRFSAWVGVDDEVGQNPGSIEFMVVGDGKIVWKSGIMKAGDAARPVEIDLKKVKKLGLVVNEGKDGMNFDHADWADARLEYSGDAPIALAHIAPAPYILTPKPARTPRINGARVFGIRPGSPFLFTIPATGDRPIQFSEQGLPEGLSLNAETGRITGRLDKAGEYTAILTAVNALGKDSIPFKIVVGETIALTPPLGWNSWNCWGGAVDAEKIKSSAHAMVEKGLINHGWTYINIDDTWQGKRGGAFKAIEGNEKFTDMKGLCDYVHNLGLKIGIYSTPWITSYAGYIGGSSDSEDGSWSKEVKEGWKHGKYPFATHDARQWAAWGMDYLKYDWNPNDVPHVEEMAKALRASGRDIVYSLSNSAPFSLASEWVKLANCWRTTGDIVDTWASVSSIGFSQDRWTPYAGPGHWNDADMLVVGHVGWGPVLHPTRLTPDEQYSHISLWCLLTGPLLLGCDLAQLDAFTLSLLTNDEVLEVNQDPLGRQAGRIRQNEQMEIWSKPMSDGSKAVGLFNKSFLDDSEEEVAVLWTELGISGKQKIRDLWRQKDLGIYETRFSAKVPAHGVVLVKITAE